MMPGDLAAVTDHKAEELLTEIVQACIRKMYPYECPVCHQPSVGNNNNKGICDSCFVIEAAQRAAYSYTEGDAQRFLEWFIEHYRGDDDDDV